MIPFVYQALALELLNVHLLSTEILINVTHLPLVCRERQMELLGETDIIYAT